MKLDKTKRTILKEAIVETVAFFDMFKYPLSSYELWQRLSLEISYKDFSMFIDRELPDCLEREGGFYFLKGHKNIIKTKTKRYGYAGRKLKRALRVAKIFRYIPWIQMIFVGNIIGAHNLKNDSDIDFFIITKNKRIWISRFFCVLISGFLRLRPQKNNTKDKICLSFFVSNNRMSLQDLMLKKETKDIYFIHWLACLVLIYDKEDEYKDFINKNQWFKEYLPNLQELINVNYDRIIVKKNLEFYSEVVEMLIGGLEKFLKKIQLKKFPKKIKTMMNKDEKVVVRSDILKFHTNDRRDFYRKNLLRKIIHIKSMNWILNRND